LDIATLLGLVLGTLFILMGIWEDALIFIHLESALIVIGGTIGSTLISFSLKQVLDAFRVLKKTFVEDREILAKNLIDILVSFAVKARSDGLLALEDDLERIDDEFLRKGIQMVVDGIEAETVRKILETDIKYLETRHDTGKKIFEVMADIAPAFGMIGTLIGLILMLKSLDDPSTIGRGMATALITTLYGAVMANFLFKPFAFKLKIRHDEEIMLKEMMVEGILSIQAGDNPRMVEENLRSFLAPRERIVKMEEEEEE